MEYHSLPRRQLQMLCKKHGIPANATNSEMADALTTLLKMQPELRPQAEKGKQPEKRATRSKQNSVGDTVSKDKNLETSFAPCLDTNTKVQRPTRSHEGASTLGQASESKQENISGDGDAKNNAPHTHVVKTKITRNATGKQSGCEIIVNPIDNADSKSVSPKLEVKKDRTGGIVLRRGKVKVRSPVKNFKNAEPTKKETEVVIGRNGDESACKGQPEKVCTKSCLGNAKKSQTKKKKGVVTFSDMVEENYLTKESPLEKKCSKDLAEDRLINVQQSASILQSSKCKALESMPIAKKAVSTRRGTRNTSSTDCVQKKPSIPSDDYEAMTSMPLANKVVSTRSATRNVSSEDSVLKRSTILAAEQKKRKDAAPETRKTAESQVFGAAKQTHEGKLDRIVSVPEIEAVPKASSEETCEERSSEGNQVEFDPLVTCTRRSRRLTMASFDVKSFQDKEVANRKHEARAEDLIAKKEVEDVPTAESLRRSSRRRTLVPSETSHVQSFVDNAYEQMSKGGSRSTDDLSKGNFARNVKDGDMARQIAQNNRKSDSKTSSVMARRTRSTSKKSGLLDNGTENSTLETQISKSSVVSLKKQSPVDDKSKGPDIFCKESVAADISVETFLQSPHLKQVTETRLGGLVHSPSCFDNDNRKGIQGLCAVQNDNAVSDSQSALEDANILLCNGDLECIISNSMNAEGSSTRTVYSVTQSSSDANKQFDLTEKHIKLDKFSSDDVQQAPEFYSREECLPIVKQEAHVLDEFKEGCSLKAEIKKTCVSNSSTSLHCSGVSISDDDNLRSESSNAYCLADTTIPKSSAVNMRSTGKLQGPTDESVFENVECSLVGYLKALDEVKTVDQTNSRTTDLLLKSTEEFSQVLDLNCLEEEKPAVGDMENGDASVELHHGLFLTMNKTVDKTSASEEQCTKSPPLSPLGIARLGHEVCLFEAHPGALDESMATENKEFGQETNLNKMETAEQKVIKNRLGEETVESKCELFITRTETEHVNESSPTQDSPGQSTPLSSLSCVQQVGTLPMESTCRNQRRCPRSIFKSARKRYSSIPCGTGTLKQLISERESYIMVGDHVENSDTSLDSFSSEEEDNFEEAQEFPSDEECHRFGYFSNSGNDTISDAGQDTVSESEDELSGNEEQHNFEECYDSEELEISEEGFSESEWEVSENEDGSSETEDNLLQFTDYELVKSGAMEVTTDSFEASLVSLSTPNHGASQVEKQDTLHINNCQDREDLSGFFAIGFEAPRIDGRMVVHQNKLPTEGSVLMTKSSYDSLMSYDANTTFDKVSLTDSFVHENSRLTSLSSLFVTPQSLAKDDDDDTLLHSKAGSNDQSHTAGMEENSWLVSLSSLFETPQSKTKDDEDAPVHLNGGSNDRACTGIPETMNENKSSLMELQGEAEYKVNMSDTVMAHDQIAALENSLVDRNDDVLVHINSGLNDQAHTAIQETMYEHKSSLMELQGEAECKVDMAATVMAQDQTRTINKVPSMPQSLVHENSWSPSSLSSLVATPHSKAEVNENRPEDMNDHASIHVNAGSNYQTHTGIQETMDESKSSLMELQGEAEFKVDTSDADRAHDQTATINEVLSASESLVDENSWLPSLPSLFASPHSKAEVYENGLVGMNAGTYNQTQIIIHETMDEMNHLLVGLQEEADGSADKFDALTSHDENPTIIDSLVDANNWSTSLSSLFATPKSKKMEDGNGDEDMNVGPYDQMDENMSSLMQLQQGAELKVGMSEVLDAVKQERLFMGAFLKLDQIQTIPSSKLGEDAHHRMETHDDCNINEESLNSEEIPDRHYPKLQKEHGESDIRFDFLHDLNNFQTSSVEAADNFIIEAAERDESFFGTILDLERGTNIEKESHCETQTEDGASNQVKIDEKESLVGEKEAGDEQILLDAYHRVKGDPVFSSDFTSNSTVEEVDSEKKTIPVHIVDIEHNGVCDFLSEFSGSLRVEEAHQARNGEAHLCFSNNAFETNESLVGTWIDLRQVKAIQVETQTAVSHPETLADIINLSGSKEAEVRHEDEGFNIENDRNLRSEENYSICGSLLVEDVLLFAENAMNLQACSSEISSNVQGEEEKFNMAPNSYGQSRTDLEGGDIIELPRMVESSVSNKMARLMTSDNHELYHCSTPKSDRDFEVLQVIDLIEDASNTKCSDEFSIINRIAEGKCTGEQDVHENIIDKCQSSEMPRQKKVRETESVQDSVVEMSKEKCKQQFELTLISVRKLRQMCKENDKSAFNNQKTATPSRMPSNAYMSARKQQQQFNTSTYPSELLSTPSRRPSNAYMSAARKQQQQLNTLTYPSELLSANKRSALKTLTSNIKKTPSTSVQTPTVKVIQRPRNLMCTYDGNEGAEKEKHLVTPSPQAPMSSKRDFVRSHHR